MERIYTGPLARGQVDLPSGLKRFVRGVPIEVDADDADSLDDDWSTPSKAPKAAKTPEVKP